jgi:hypothetical protein
MTYTQIVGWILILLPFIAVFAALVAMADVRFAVGVFAVSGLVVAAVVTGARLIE